MKRCKSCGIEKAISEFQRARRPRGLRPTRGGFGVQSVCKECKSHNRNPLLRSQRENKAELQRAGLKQCGSCKEVKPFASFHMRRASPDGLALKCVDCVIDTCRKWRIKNPNAFHLWHQENSEHRAGYWRKWYAENREHRSKSFSKWAKENPHITNANAMRRYAAKMNASPLWADQNAIRRIYKKAVELTKKTGIKHHVDHIYPLQSKIVCGLHCEANLQILTLVENIRKNNRMPEELGYA